MAGCVMEQPHELPIPKSPRKKIRRSLAPGVEKLDFARASPTSQFEYVSAMAHAKSNDFPLKVFIGCPVRFLIWKKRHARRGQCAEGHLRQLSR